MTGEMHEQTMAHEAAQEGQPVQETPRAFFRPKPDGNTDPAGEAGWYLERERERRGLSLQTVSRATGVHPQHLRAIELGMLENLPERAEALRMIGAYARFLGFDPQPLVAHYEAHLPQQQQQQKQKAFSSAHIISFPLLERLRSISRTPAGMGAAVLTAVMLFGGMGWALWPVGSSAPSAQQEQVVAQASQPASDTRDNAANAEQSVAALAGKQQAKADADADATEAPVQAEEKVKAADPIGALIARTMQGTPDSVVEDVSQPHQTTKKPLPAPVAPPVEAARDMPLPPPPAESASDVPVRLMAAADTPLDPRAVKPVREVPAKGIALRAAEQIWLRLEDDSGLPWFVGFLKAGEVLALPADRSLRLSASDVHRLEWYVNGQRMGTLGKRGADLLSEPLDQLYRQSGLKPPSNARTAG